MASPDHRMDWMAVSINTLLNVGSLSQCASVVQNHESQLLRFMGHASTINDENNDGKSDESDRTDQTPFFVWKTTRQETIEESITVLEPGKNTKHVNME